MKANLLICMMILLCISLRSSAQTVTTDQKSIGSSKVNSAKAIWVHDSTGYLVIGVVDTTNHRTRIWMINMDPNTGDTIWTRIYDSGLPAGGVSGFSVASTSDNGRVIGGTAVGYADHTQAIVTKTDESGNLEWSETIGDANDSDDFQNTMVGMREGGSEIIVAGFETYGTLSSKTYLLAMSPLDGSILWYKIYNVESGESFYVTDYDDDGEGYVLYGDYYNPTTNSYKFGILLTDYDGNIENLETYGGLTGDWHADYGTGNPQTGFMVGGTFNYGTTSDALVAKISPSHTINWAKTYSGGINDYAYSIARDNNYNFYIAGMTNSGHGGLDGLEFSIDSSGNLFYAKAFGGSGNDAFRSIGITNNKLIAVGYTNSWGPGLTNAYINQTQLDGFSCNDDDIDLSVNPVSLISAPASVTADSTGLVFNMITLTQKNAGAAVVDVCTITGVETPIVAQNSTNIFPNPSSGHFTISFTHPVNNCTVEILNTLGEVVYSNQIDNTLTKNSEEINLNAPPGIYFIRLSQNEQQSTYKLMLF